MVKRLQLIVLLIYFSFSGFNVQSQTFERVESIIGLGVLQENHGVSVADYDGDNDLDLFVVAKSLDQNNLDWSFSRLFRNDNNGSFTDVTESAGLSNLLNQDFSQDDTYYVFDGPKVGAFWGDYDNDGYPDLFLTNTYNVKLFKNQGDGTFLDITESAGFSLATDCQYTGATWFDYNNDGFLDIYISEWGNCDSNLMFKNNANGTFTDITVEANMLEVNSRYSFTAVPFDFNSDGWMDLYVTNDFDAPNYLYINVGDGTFEEQADAYGVGSTIDDMGVAVGDYNLDGNFDFFITGIGESALLKSDQGSYVNVAVDEGVYNNSWAWMPTFSDFDCDGDEDLFVANGYFNSGSYNNFYYVNTPDAPQNVFENQASAVGFSESTMSMSTVDFDYDNDGDLDLFLSNTNTDSYFYENKLWNFDVDASNANWFQLSLKGTVSNRSAIGTKVTLTTENRTIRRYFSGVGFLGQSMKPLHFGLHADETIEELVIKWPSGLEETYTTGLEINSFFNAKEGDALTNLNITASQKIYGCTDPNSCNYNPEATLSDDTCVYLTEQEISGPNSTGFLAEESYSYAITEGSTAQWQVTGGELLEGQGTGSILVKWGLNQSGEITVVENNGDCFSESASISVVLGNEGVPEDVSVARLWNEALLAAIRKDFARPTVHARNLFHSSVAMYDAWAVYDEEATTYMVGKTVHGFSSDLTDFESNESVQDSRNKAISYAMYRLLTHRFQNSPNQTQTQARFDYLMEQLNYDINNTATDYINGDPAALGNYIAETIINYGFTDGSNEAGSYANEYYESVNPPLSPEYETSTILDPNRWQPLSLDVYIDQSGNLIEGDMIEFLGPEWGNVHGFSLSDEDQSTYQRDGDTYYVYHDPSDPPYLADDGVGTSSDAYKWAFELVSVWGSHLDPTDGVMWDVSPNSIGGLTLESLPTSYLEHPNFYNLFDGGDPGPGHDVNPSTGMPYDQQVVPRGDYTRVLAEFWADGPHSETPPGHWFTILNYVSDHPLLEKKLNGQGDVLPSLEWDVKTYFILGGAMHDSAISAWSVKGWYDYIRPISAIRYMASKGQSSDESLPSYHPEGIPLIPGYVEVVEDGDPLAGAENQFAGKIKLYSWLGHGSVYDPETDTAGVGWILSENWWPYQRPSFVTPPFAGYVSGHSTFSRAAAEVMTLITGDEYFPGGMGEFVARKNEFLVFEEGPSVDVTLQWATYRDASDQCSLSRIWGGIHPPSDDVPGRLMGADIGVEAYDFAIPYFYGTLSVPDFMVYSKLYPNPVQSGHDILITNITKETEFKLYDLSGRDIQIQKENYDLSNRIARITIPSFVSVGVYVLNWNNHSEKIIVKN